MSISPSDLQSLGQSKNLVSPTVDSETEEFRKYLENSGVLDVITRVLKEMYEQENRPSNPFAYFVESLESAGYYGREIAALNEEIAALQEKNQEMKLLIDNLEKENRILRQKSEVNLD